MWVVLSYGIVTMSTAVSHTAPDTSCLGVEPLQVPGARARASLLYLFCPALLFPFTFEFIQTEPSASCWALRSFASQTKIGIPSLLVHWDFLFLSSLAAWALVGS